MQEGVAVPEAPPASVVAPAPPANARARAGRQVPQAAAVADERPPPPTLDDAARLDPSSDFRRFVAPDVTPEVKNAALKKLFADPHYNVMDGLDTYIDDYGKPDPIPASMLRQMVQSQVPRSVRRRRRRQEGAGRRGDPRWRGPRCRGTVAA